MEPKRHTCLIPTLDQPGDLIANSLGAYLQADERDRRRLVSGLGLAPLPRAGEVARQKGLREMHAYTIMYICTYMYIYVYTHTHMYVL